MCNYFKINPIILSCITNYAAGIESTPVKHSHVINNAKKSKLIYRITNRNCFITEQHLK